MKYSYILFTFFIFSSFLLADIIQESEKLRFPQVIQSIAFHPHKKKIAIASLSTIYIWNWVNKEIELTLRQFSLFFQCYTI